MTQKSQVPHSQKLDLVKQNLKTKKNKGFQT